MLKQQETRGGHKVIKNLPLGTMNIHSVREKEITGHVVSLLSFLQLSVTHSLHQVLTPAL